MRCRQWVAACGRRIEPALNRPVPAATRPILRSGRFITGKFTVAEQYKLVFSGRIAEGMAAADVVVGLARLLKTEPAKIAPMFSGQTVVLRKGLDEATAQQYLAALAKVGALAERVPMVDVVPPPVRPAAPLPPALAPVAPAIARAAAGAPVAPALDLAPVGATLLEVVAVNPPAIDTSHLSVLAPGPLLLDTEIVAAPFFDLSELSLAPPGATLAEAPEVPPAEFDLSRLSLAN